MRPHSVQSFQFNRTQFCGQFWMGHLRAHNIIWALLLCSLLYNNRAVLVIFEQWSCFVMLECAGSYVMLCSYYTKTGQTCMRDNWDTGGIVTRWTTWNISAISAADPVYGILTMKKKLEALLCSFFWFFFLWLGTRMSLRGTRWLRRWAICGRTGHSRVKSDPLSFVFEKLKWVKSRCFW